MRYPAHIAFFLAIHQAAALVQLSVFIALQQISACAAIAFVDDCKSLAPPYDNRSKMFCSKDLLCKGYFK
jgi:hypothetical protein